MKKSLPARILMFLLLYTFLPGSNTYSQCGDGSHYSVITYDILFTGGGNTSYDPAFPQFDTSLTYFRLPQFNPSKGTLVEVDIETVINVKYGFEQENTDIVKANTYKIMMNRSDVIASALFPEFRDDKSIRVATNVLAASDMNDGSGNDYIKAGPLYAYNHFTKTNSIFSGLAGFMGNDSVYFNYTTTTDLYSLGSNSHFTGYTEDSVSFKLIYKFCLTSILPADITNFTATKSSGNIQLSWSSPNDNAGNRYEMQKSTDGKNFISFETIISKSGASNNYQVMYTSTGDDKNKVFFRIKQFESDGSVKYSSVKAVDLDYTATTMKVYPTVTKNDFNIYFPYAAKGDYQVSIVSITGQVMQQDFFTRTNFIKVILNAGIQTGMYIVSVVNKQTSEKQQSKILIQ